MQNPYRTYAIFSRRTTAETRKLERDLTDHVRRHYPDIRQGSLTEAQLLLVLGGDGTLLEAARASGGASETAHLLAFNAGHEGFLSSVRQEALFFKTLGMALDSALIPMSIPVMRISHRSKKKTAVFSAVNDLLLEQTLTWITMRIEIVRENGAHLVKEIRGSGVCICSPIGSTTCMAAHFQAPIIDPEVKAFYLKGTNDMRSPTGGLLVSAIHQKLRIVVTDVEANPGIPEDFRQAPALFADGIRQATVSVGDVIELAYHDTPAILLRVSYDAHWDRVRDLRR